MEFFQLGNRSEIQLVDLHHWVIVLEVPVLAFDEVPVLAFDEVLVLAFDEVPVLALLDVPESCFHLPASWFEEPVPLVSALRLSCALE